MYRKLYFTLFNAITDALELIGRGDTAAARSTLEQAQLAAEDCYMGWEEDAPPLDSPGNA